LLAKRAPNHKRRQTADKKSSFTQDAARKPSTRLFKNGGFRPSLFELCIILEVFGRQKAALP
jgi:hypothetical protein